MAESIPAVELEAVTRRYGDVVAVDNVTLSIAEGEFFSLLGPSGCGKTTTLRVIAGFEMPTSGSVRIRGQEMGDTPPFKRPVNTVFQSYALFPHMTVAQNVAFGLEMKKVSRDEIKRRVAEALEMVQLPQMAHRKPRQLSGGQRQRIALARALVNRPQVLLLDEPLGALDLKLRKAMQLELKALQEQVGITFIYVTHDQEEALTMSDRIAVINQGRIYQVGSPLEIYERPASRFVADFIGETNFLEGQVETVTAGQVVIIVDGAVRVNALSGRPVSPGQAVSVAVRPEKISLQRTGDALSLSKGGIRGRIEELIYIGTDTRYVVRLTDRARLTVRTQNVSARDVQQFHQGEEVGLSWDADGALVLVD